MARKFSVDAKNLKAIDTLQTGTVWVMKNLPKEAFLTIGTTATDWDGAGSKRSSQHQGVGGCDGHSKAAVGSVWASTITVTGSASCGGAR